MCMCLWNERKVTCWGREERECEVRRWTARMESNGRVVMFGSSNIISGT